jgi:nicotinamidase-related amidase
MALLVIDVQVGLVDSDGEHAAHQGAQMLENINRLIVTARAAGTPVIYIQHDGGAGG